MSPFPFLFFGWRESIVGCQPDDLAYLQVEPTRRAGSTAGKSLGHVRWRMEEDFIEKRRCRVLRYEAFEAATGELQTEDIWIDLGTNAIVRQDAMRKKERGVDSASSVFFLDRIETKRKSWDGTTVDVTVRDLPEGGMAALQRRFEPLEGGTKEFAVYDGLTDEFRKIRVDKGGRFAGKMIGDHYEGNIYRFSGPDGLQTVMVTPEGEIVQIDLPRGISLAITTATKSRRRTTQPISPSRA